MTISTLVKTLRPRSRRPPSMARRSSAGAATNTITLINGSNEGDVTLVFTARATESFVLVEGYQVNDVETVTNNMVTLSGAARTCLDRPGSKVSQRSAATP